MGLYRRETAGRLLPVRQEISKTRRLAVIFKDPRRTVSHEAQRGVDSVDDGDMGRNPEARIIGMENRATVTHFRTVLGEMRWAVPVFPEAYQGANVAIALQRNRFRVTPRRT
jgi:hypothetical protein